MIHFHHRLQTKRRLEGPQTFQIRPEVPIPCHVNINVHAFMFRNGNRTTPIHIIMALSVAVDDTAQKDYKSCIMHHVPTPATRS